jgi:DNA invertase Pin-like site-specific DNA recombinase
MIKKSAYYMLICYNFSQKELSMKKVIIYTRVSTKEQSVESQKEKLKELAKNHDYEIVVIFEDVGSGKNLSRDGYNSLLREIHLRSFDILLIWKLDRLSRSLKDLVEMGELLNSKGIDLVSYDGSVDTTTPQGRLMFQMMGVFAEFQRGLIVENVKSGLDRAKARGVQLGRPKKEYTPKLMKKALELKSQGVGWKRLAKELGFKNNHMTLKRRVEEYKKNRLQLNK